MAWKEQCKVAFKTTVAARSGPKGGIVKTMRQLSRESGIPFGTLKDWYYEKENSEKSESQPREITIENKIKSITTRLKAARSILESLPAEVSQLPEWDEMLEAFGALGEAISFR